MKLGIIYGEISTQHQLLMERAEDIFDSVLAAPVDGLKMVHTDEGQKVLYKDVDLTEFDAVYIRTSDRDMLFSEHLVEILNEEGVVTQAANDTYSYESNKFYSMKVLAETGIKVPDSVYTLSPDVAVEAAETLGYPIIMKTIKGGGGEGVMRASSENELKPVMDTMKSFEQEICLQDFKEHAGTDNRVIVIGDEVMAYSRSSSGDEWRSNISGGGERKKAELTEEMKTAALRAARATGFDICGCDVIETEEDAYVLEVNGSYGINEEMNEIIGRDVMLLMVERLHERAMKKQRN
ncbi:MAG: RimK family alpha-L-glutamate ligase [Nanohaloarchaea archaeon]|nr:RimK family alpha-L-glutamate ligase [Candidatus Nanohaloarchaea archaeon]